jgi:hypothetical protein
MKFKMTWDLTSIPDEILRSEWARRNSLRRTICAGGRPPTVTPCAFCSLEFSSVELRRHRPGCRQEFLLSLGSQPINLWTNSRDSSSEPRWRITLITREMLTLRSIDPIGSGIEHEICIPVTSLQAIDRRGSPAVTLAGALSFSKARGWAFTSTDGSRSYDGRSMPKVSATSFGVI